MKNHITLSLVSAWLLVGTLNGLAADQEIINVSASPHVKFRTIGLDDARWTSGFLADRWDTDRRVTIPTMKQVMELPDNSATFHNLRVAAGTLEGKFVGNNWSDSDCYKWIEAAASVYSLNQNPELDRQMDEAIAVIAKAQVPDGYISTQIQLTDKGRWTNLSHHELYNMGQPAWRITNGTLAVTVSQRDAGAVCSLVYDGQEFVNDHDHGRQLQVAWFYNDLGEAYNPTEAGADKDGVGPRSTSQLVSVQANGNTLQTVNHPAHWRHTSLPEKHRKNTTLVSKDTLTKKLILGCKGDPHVLVFDTTVAISPELTGPPMNSIRIEAPTLYSHPQLSRHHLFDLASGELKEVPSRARNFDQMNEVIRHVTRHDVVPILSSRDGRHAVALFTPQREHFWAYYTHDVPSKDPTNACGKMTAFFKHAVAAGQSYSYRTFIVVGDLATIKTSIRRLHTGAEATLPPQNKP